MPRVPAVDAEPVDVLLLFPPQTEARFFPYLSLPCLTGHLRRRGRRVHQADLNIALLHELLRKPHLLDAAARAQGGDGMRDWYRREMAEVVDSYLTEIRAHVMRKASPGDLGAARSVRLARQALELFVRDTFLISVWRDLEALDRAARRAADRPPAASGAAVEVLHRLVTDLLARHPPRVAGLSVAFFSQLGPALLIAAWIRELAPRVKICLGGQQIMLRDADLAVLPGLRRTLDALCWTAGEEPLERWLDALDGTIPPAAVPGMTWLPRSGAVGRSRRPPSLRFHDLGPPDHTGLPVRSYLNEGLEVAIVSCVGCYWGRCAFCAYGNRSLPPGRYQQATVRQVADAVETVVRDTGTRFVAIADENTNLRLISKAMRAVRERGVRVRFGVRSRLEPGLADPAFCRALAEVGCAMIAVGYEGTSQRLLDLMDRGVRAADYQRIVDTVTGAGITLRLSVMGHVLDERPEEFEESLRFLAVNERRIGIDALELMVPEPGSRLAQDPERFGVSLDTSGPLAGNPELSYLAGRVGYPLTVHGGPTRTEALSRLEQIFQVVRPGRVSAVHPPSHRATARGDSCPAGPPDAARPYPWVRTVPARLDTVPDRTVVADLVWEQFYALPHRDVEQHPDGLLTARTARGQRLLARLVDVSAAEPSPAVPPSTAAPSGPAVLPYPAVPSAPASPPYAAQPAAARRTRRPT
ncbi:B12-binding domain-containing radical SAM protein [Streptomyces chrestomyceticus]|uniref:B12-binding domain-containing radical SAM protein n=1 Tax=Streptomyces chrestomyceticus TaxID=68185 RepID=UPI0019D0D204|nr:radical SAM protein [Streptomyces chrestomyceticus]